MALWVQGSLPLATRVDLVWCVCARALQVMRMTVENGKEPEKGEKKREKKAGHNRKIFRIV